MLYENSSSWFVKKKKRYTLALNCACNNENENFNKAGSFVVFRNGNEHLVDIDSMFSASNTKSPCSSSLEYSAPVINGKAQHNLSDYYGKISADNNEITIDIKDAYNEPALKSLERKFEFYDRAIKLTDSFEFHEKGEYICRLVSQFKPRFYDNNVIVGSLFMEYNDADWEVKLTREKYTSSEGKDLIVFFIDFIPLKEVNSFELNIKVFEQLKMTCLLNKIPPYKIEDGFEIRMYKPGDEQAWTDICKNDLLEANEGIECWEKYMLCFDTLVPENDTFFVYNKDGEAVATCTCFVEESGNGNFHMVAAKPESRGHGLGHSMTSYALNKIKNELNKENFKVNLKSDEWRIPAVRSYLKAGYQPVLYDVGMEERWRNLCNKLDLHNIEMLDDNGNPTGIIL